MGTLRRRFDVFETWKATIDSRLVKLEAALNHQTPNTQPQDLNLQNFVAEHFAKEKRIQSKKLNMG